MILCGLAHFLSAVSASSISLATTNQNTKQPDRKGFIAKAGHQHPLKHKRQANMEGSSGSDEDYAKYWIDWFLNTKGNEYFCEVDEDYILDRFNLTGLNSEVQHYYLEALDMITDNLDEEAMDEKIREQIEKAARHLYGLIHARFIITTRGLAKMMDKYKKAEFGRCPRVLCNNQQMLPVGQTDVPQSKTVKLYCPKCEDIYNPKSSRHASIDGAYFGTSMPHMLFQVPSYLNHMPQKSTERYEPRIFGFKVHAIAEQHRLQDEARRKVEERKRAIEPRHATPVVVDDRKGG